MDGVRSLVIGNNLCCLRIFGILVSLGLEKALCSHRLQVALCRHRVWSDKLRFLSRHDMSSLVDLVRLRDGPWGRLRKGP